MSSCVKSAGLIVAAVSVLTSCSDTTLGTRTFTETLPLFFVPGNSQVQLLVNNQDFSVPLNLTNQAAYSDSDLDYISYINVRSLQLQIDSSSDTESRDDGNLDDFDFLSKLEVYLRATIDGQVYTNLVASLPDGDVQYASGSRTLNLTTNGVDILNYIERGDGYDMVIRASGITPLDPVIVGGTIRYQIGIGFR